MMRPSFVFLRCWTVLWVVVSALTAPGTFGQTQHRAPQKKAAPAPAAAWTKIDSTQDIELRLSSGKSTQGSLVQQELRSATPLADVSGTWDDKPVPFWPETAPAAKTV